MAVKNEYPVVLAHGIARFDFLTHSMLKKINLLLCSRSLSPDNLNYFRGINSFLRKNGITAFNTNVSFAADVKTRALDLRNEILKILKSGFKKVHIIAHSMGGLDARYMIASCKDMENRIASLTTIGTPHLGTSFADWGMKYGYKIIETIDWLIDLKGFCNLTRSAAGEFNSICLSSEASNPVFYQTFYCRQEKRFVFLPFQKSWEIIFDAEGENDCLVSVKSQKWTDKVTDRDGKTKIICQKEFPVPADHFNEVGWWNINQLKITDWHDLIRLGKMKEYENEIKAIYLQTARDLRSLDL